MKNYYSTHSGENKIKKHSIFGKTCKNLDELWNKMNMKKVKLMVYNNTEYLCMGGPVFMFEGQYKIWTIMKTALICFKIIWWNWY